MKLNHKCIFENWQITKRFLGHLELYKVFKYPISKGEKNSAFLRHVAFLQVACRRTFERGRSPKNLPTGYYIYQKKTTNDHSNASSCRRAKGLTTVSAKVGASHPKIPISTRLCWLHVLVTSIVPLSSTFWMTINNYT